MNKHLYLAILFTSAILLTSSCGREQGKTSGADSELTLAEPNAEAVAEADTLPAEPPAPKLILPTTEKQLEYMMGSADSTLYSKGILPQMAQDAPEYCERVLQKGSRFIIVDKAKMKLFLYDPYGNIEKNYGIACAKNYGARHKNWDSRTPEGIFHIYKICNSSEWRFRDENGEEGEKGVFGPKFLGIIPQIGIHGTSNPSSIGKRVSHGCIRVTNANILELVEYVDSGMPVIISPGPYDMFVNQKEGKHILAVVTEPGTGKASPRELPVHKPVVKENPVEETTGIEEGIETPDSQPEPSTEKETGEETQVQPANQASSSEIEI